MSRSLGSLDEMTSCSVVSSKDRDAASPVDGANAGVVCSVTTGACGCAGVTEIGEG